MQPTVHKIRFNSPVHLGGKSFGTMNNLNVSSNFSIFTEINSKFDLLHNLHAFYSVPNDKILDSAKLKAFADDNDEFYS